MEDNKDILWGVERTPQSSLFGRLVCPTINLFETPHGKRAGYLQHNTPVVIMEEKEVDGRKFYRVKSLDYKNKSGWVTDAFLLNRGAFIERHNPEVENKL